MEKGEAESLGPVPSSPEALEKVDPQTDTPIVNLCICLYIDLYLTDKTFYTPQNNFICCPTCSPFHPLACQILCITSSLEIAFPLYIPISSGCSARYFRTSP